jgi:hypothetical protein
MTEIDFAYFNYEHVLSESASPSTPDSSLKVPARNSPSPPSQEGAQSDLAGNL